MFIECHLLLLYVASFNSDLSCSKCWILPYLQRCLAISLAYQVVKSGDCAGQTPFEIIISLNTSKYFGYGDEVCLCVCVRACMCVCVCFVALQMEEAASRYRELALNVFSKQPQTSNK